MVADFTARVGELAGVVHCVEDLAAARARGRELIGDATVARWADAELDGIASSEIADAAAADVSLIRADVGIAETGAIGFVHRAGRPRAAALLPDRQVALLAASELVATVPDALARIATAPPGSFVLVAGPSRTADIEQRMILGVHAPRTLDVILYGCAA